MAVAVEAAIRAGREAAERLMTTQVVIVRPGDMSDPVTGEPVTTPLYDGKAKLTSYEGHESASLAGNREVSVQRMELHLPVGRVAVRRGDLVSVVGSRDALLVGREFRITQKAPYKEHATAYRCTVEER